MTEEQAIQQYCALIVKETHKRTNIPKKELWATLKESQIFELVSEDADIVFHFFTPEQWVDNLEAYFYRCGRLLLNSNKE